MNPDPEVAAIGLVIVIAAVFVGIAKLAEQRRAKPIPVAVLLLMPFLYLFGIQIVYGGIPPQFSTFSDGIVVGVISSLIAGVILAAVFKR